MDDSRSRTRHILSETEAQRVRGSDIGKIRAFAIEKIARQREERRTRLVPGIFPGLSRYPKWRSHVIRRLITARKFEAAA